MKIKDLILGYLLLAICWYFGITAFECIWLPLTCFVIVLPVIASIIMHFKKDSDQNQEHRRYHFIYCCILCAVASFYSYLGVQEGKINSHRAVAIVEDINTATQIENILFEHYDLGTVRELDGINHMISLKTRDKSIVADAQVVIASDRNIDLSKLTLPMSYPPQKTKEKTLKEASKELKNKILRIEDVMDAAVELKEVQANENNDQNAQFIPEINIYITTTSCAKKHEIIRVTKNIILGTYKRLTDENIWIEFIREDCANKEIGTRCEPKLVKCKE